MVGVNNVGNEHLMQSDQHLSGKEVRQGNPSICSGMCSNVNAYLFSRNCTAHIEWLKNVFDVQVGEIHYFKEDPTRIMHTCISFQDGGKVMMSDYSPGDREKCSSDRGFAISLEFTEGQGQKIWNKAIENGGKVDMEYSVQFWGSHFGSFVDPFGFSWFVVEPIKNETVSDAKKDNADAECPLK